MPENLSFEQIAEWEDARHSGATTRRPVAIVRGQGATLWDSQGRSYIDCGAGQGWAGVGHCHPRVSEAIRAQSERLVAHTESSYNDQRALWFRDLAAVLGREFEETPKGALTRLHPCNSGAEANETALKLARSSTGRTGVVAATRSFHGRTMGALSATGTAKYRDPFAPLVPGFTHVPYNDLDALRNAVGQDTAAVLLETVQGEGGVYCATREYLQGARRICDEQGALLIIDEVQTGLGRTGRWFGCQHADLQPDIITLGKALGGGIPMGAAAWREGVGRFAPGSHGGTFGGNPLACAAGRAVLSVIEAEGLPQRAAKLGQEMIEELKRIRSPEIRQVRGVGMMIGVELRHRVTPVLKGLLDRGVWALPAGPCVLRLLPPLVIEEALIEQALQAIGEVLSG